MSAGDDSGTTLLLVGLLLLAAVAAGRGARHLCLPSLTGHLVAGLGVGAVCAQLRPGSLEFLVVLRQLASAALLFWIGTQLTSERIRRHRRAVVHALIAVCASVVLCAAAILGAGLLGVGGDRVGALAWSDVALVALVLSATSPTVIAVVARECDPEAPLSRAGLEGSLIANSVILVLAAMCCVISARTAGRVEAAAMLGMLSEVAAGAVVGAVLAASLAATVGRWPRTLPLAFAALAVLYARQELVASEPATAVGALAAGVTLARSWPALAGKVESTVGSGIPIVGTVLFVVAGAMVDVTAILAVVVPAVALFAVRGVALWVGSRVAGALDRERDAAPLGVAPWLPQAGFSLVLLGLMDMTPMAASLGSIVFVVVVLNEVATPPLLHRALVAWHDDEVLAN